MSSNKIHHALTIISAPSIPAAKHALAILNVAEAVHYIEGTELHDWTCTYLGREIVHAAQNLNPDNPLIYVHYLRAALLKANRPTVVVYTARVSFGGNLVECVDLAVDAWDESKPPVILELTDASQTKAPVKSELEFYIDEYCKADADWVAELKQLAAKYKDSSLPSKDPISSPDLQQHLARSIAYGSLIKECGVSLDFMDADVQQCRKLIAADITNAKKLGHVKPYTVPTNERVLQVMVDYSKLKVADYFDTRQLDHIEFYKRCINIPNALHQLIALGEFCKEANSPVTLILADEHDLHTDGKGTRIGVITIDNLTPSDFICINTIAKDAGIEFNPDYFYFITNTIHRVPT